MNGHITPSAASHLTTQEPSLQTPSIPEEVVLPANAPLPAVPKKPSTMNRLTRMFSQTKVPSATEGSSQRQPEIGPPEADGTNTARKTSVWKPKPPSRQQSLSDKRPSSAAESERRASIPAIKKDVDPNHRRFEPRDDGTHEHFLRSAKRQEKLSDMLRDMLGGKRREEHPGNDEQQLSLMSTWVDQLKNEREKLASDKKGGPNATATLVQKYGKCQEIVGRGAFGIVRISHKPDPKDSRVEQLYAVKEFRRRPQESPKKYQKRLTSEFCISSSLRHPNVIHTLDLLQDAKGDYCEVMEFCAGGDLYTLVLTAGHLEVKEADCFFKQLMCGVEYLHEMGVAHRDLKPENLLLTTRGSLKITDFGNGECFRMAWEKEAHMTAGLCGSAPYIAPEEYTEREFDPRPVDVWATGVIYMAMRTGRHLWRIAKSDEDEFYARYLVGRKDENGYGPIETLHRDVERFAEFLVSADLGSIGFKKNVNRATTQVMMKTGHVEKTNDRDYEVEERRYRTMESAANRLQKEAKGYLDSLRAMTASQMRIAETIDAFYGDAGANDGVSRSYKQAVEDLDAETIKALDGPFRQTVLEPISRFCAYFPDINECIKKRNHKLLDYDATRARVKKLVEKPDKDPSKLPRAERESDLARSAYETLNEQLFSELPQLIDLRVPYLDPSFEALVKIQLRFCAEAYSRMAQVQQFLDADTREQYAQGHLDSKVEQVLGEIRELSIAGTV
ncbi:MAG: hypothetical protein LQ341_000881 [Variospora aurantia]|nr:MAG: hypothetical protein LQ341_000881 [Variospora aurantia]